MAEPNPRDSSLAPRLNSWGYIQIPKENDLTDVLKDAKTQSDALFEAISLSLRLLGQVLDLVSTFLVGLADPVKLTINAILSLLNSLANDLRALGLYLTYDRAENPLESFKGGYAAYEQRIIKKLIDQADPTRPNFSQSTSVFALHFFGGVGGESISRIQRDVIKPIQKLIKFFTDDVPEVAKPAPRDLSVNFYRQIGPLTTAINKGDVDRTPDGVTLSWSVPKPQSTNPYFSSSWLAPRFFLVCVYTRSQGERLAVGVTRVITRSEAEGGDLEVVEPKPLSTPAHLHPLFEGERTFRLDDGVVEQGVLKGYSNILSYGYDPIMVESQTETHTSEIDGRSLKEVYRAYVVSSEEDKVYEGEGSFSINFTSESLKVGGVLQDSYYAKVYGLDADPNDIMFSDVDGLLSYANEQVVISSGLTPTVSLPNLTEGTEEVVFSFPTRQTTELKKALRQFYCAFILSRVDAPSVKAVIAPTESDENIAQALKLIGFSSSIELEKELYEGNPNREVFAQRVLDLVDRAVEQTPLIPPSVVADLNFAIREVNNYTWDFYSLLTASTERGHTNIFLSGEIGGYATEGILPNHRYPNRFGATWEEFASDFQTDPSARKYLAGSVYLTSPYLFLSSQRILSVVGGLEGMSDHLTYGFTLLFTAQANSSGAWLSYRPFKNSNLKGFLDVVDTIKGYAEAISAGLDDMVQVMLNYINSLKVRLAELQRIIKKIKALIDAILGFSLPTGLYATFHSGNGTGGLVNAVLTSDNKPDIDKEGIGMGVMLVGGGVPVILTDLLIALMGGEG